MNDAHYDAVFYGVHGSTAGTVPAWYRDVKGTTRGSSVEFPHLRESAAELTEDYGAALADAYYYDEARGEYVEVPERAVIVNPAWLGDGLESAPKTSAAWTTASAEYEPVTASDAYEPLADMATEFGLVEAFGSFETYRNGGEVVVEVLFDDLRFEDAESDTEFVLGFESGYDHYRRSSVWATLLAYDVNTGAALRGLSERYTRSHRGDEVRDDLREWFRVMLGRVERLDDTLTQVVAESRAYEVPLCDMPVNVAEFYEAQGFPQAFGETAAAKLRNHRRPSAFSLYLAMAETVTTEFDGKKGGSALRKHAGRTNDLLFSPPSAEQTALVNVRQKLGERGQTRLEPNGVESAAEALDDRIDSLDAGVAAFSSMRERFRAMLDDLADEDEDESETDEAREVAA